MQTLSAGTAGPGTDSIYSGLDVVQNQYQDLF